RVARRRRRHGVEGFARRSIGDGSEWRSRGPIHPQGCFAFRDRTMRKMFTGREVALSVALWLVAAGARADDVTPPPPPENASTNEKVPPTPPPSAPQPPSAESTPKPPNVGGEFSFGSYGRVITASDLRGGSGRQANVVTHG